MPTYNAYAVSGIAPPSFGRRRRGVSSHPVLALSAQFPTGHSTTVGPTGARLRVRCLSARGSSGAPSETADFERSNGTGFEPRHGRHRHLIGLVRLKETQESGSVMDV